MYKKVSIGLLVVISFSFLLPTLSYSCRSNLSEIVSPEPRAKLNGYPVEIVVDFTEEARPETFEAWLNRKNITEKFEGIEGGMRAFVDPEDGLKIWVKGEPRRGWYKNRLWTMVRGPKGKRDIDFRQFCVSMTYHEKVVEDFAINSFETIRNVIDPEDDTKPRAEFIGNHIEVKSEKWVYILDIAGQQIFRPIATYPHMVSSFSQDIGPILGEWMKLAVPQSTINLANQLTLSIFGVSYIGTVAANIDTNRELIVSKAADSETVRHYEGRTMVNFSRPAIPDDLMVRAYQTSITYTPDGQTLASVKPVDLPSRSYETAITFAPEGDVMRVESTFVTPEVREVVDLFNEGLMREFISAKGYEYDRNLRFGSFFGGHEWRFELTAYSWESEAFLDPTVIGVCVPDNYYDECNPYFPYDPFDWCYNAYLAPDVNTYIRLTQWYKYDFWKEWCIYGKTNGIRGNWDWRNGSWEAEAVRVARHKDLGTYDVAGGTTRTGVYKTCEPVYLTVPRDDEGTLEILEQAFYDDLESCHAAILNTHGGYAWCDTSYQFQSKPDVWVSLHREGDDGLGKGNLRHLFLLTCSSMQWNHGPLHGEPANLFSDWMNSHVADGIRTICGYDSGAAGYHSNGFKFFESYHKGDSISQSWFNMGLRESLSNIPVVVSYGSNEAEAAATLFDGRFTKTRGDTGWIIAAELVTDHLIAHQACCLPDGRCEGLPWYECTDPDFIRNVFFLPADKECLGMQPNGCMGTPKGIGTICKSSCGYGSVECE